MIRVDLAPAAIALLEMASEERRAARCDVPQGAGLRGRQAVTAACPVHGAVEAENLRRFQHRDLGERSKTLHKLVERVGQCGPRLTRQMGVDPGGAGAAVAEIFLDQAQVDPGLEQVGGAGMAPMPHAA
jgi:hypothetical protein